jgi:dihydropteroate synthase
METFANSFLVPLTVRERSFVWGDRTYLMGVLNVTPDSFSDGGEFNNLAAAVAQANYLVESGADIIDIGGQSTKPGAKEVSLAEELNRVLPVVQAIRPGITVPISIDTTRSVVANAAVKALSCSQCRS